MSNLFACSPSPELLEASSSRPTLVSIPSTIEYPWLYQMHVSGDQDFASNASTWSIRQPTIVVTENDDHTTQKNVEDFESSICGQERERRKGLGLDVTASLAPGAIRNRPIRSQRVYQRAFHTDHPLNYLQVSPTSKLHKLPLELPLPTSPTRPRRFRSLRHTWLNAFCSSVNASRLRSRPSLYLALYFTLNLGLTLYNKSVLIHFPFPYTLSAIHALCGSIGTFVLVRISRTPPPKLNFQETLILLAFSFLYTINIIVSNVSLGLVTVPFHQVVRASTPLFTILFSASLFGAKSSRAKLIALIPVVTGVGFATYGDYYFTPWGFFLTLFGTILAALKTIYTNLLQTHTSLYRATSLKSDPRVRSKILTKTSPSDHAQAFRVTLPPLTPLHLLYLLSPLAFIETTLLAHFSGELGRVHEYSVAGIRYPLGRGYTHGLPSFTPGLSNMLLWLLMMNGVMAFALNVVSFSANRKVGALSMTVAANVKQVLTILCAVIMFNLTITPTNALGIGLTLIGGAFYTAVELKERRER
ncbi:triose-phosphate transporter family-domain-containing protein [Collybia nuda]|uniref:Triose-phosphate transporter family-domain-containing protein n=1 Tax=Collybia nuda TaxID=64659 RepID=A0A9P5YDB9_9AGAR|nr:triose-phosphate transporter family-domain-containing protein [Collybia nuda]